MAHFHAASCMGVIKVPEAGQRGAEGREGVMEEEEWRIFHHPAIVFPLFAIGIVKKMVHFDKRRKQYSFGRKKLQE